MSVQVKIRLGDGPVGTCPIGVLPVWEAKGYELVPDDDAAVDAPTNEDVPLEVEVTDLEIAGRILKASRDDVELFDPAEHTVAEVEDHLIEADDVEFARVIAAEAEGKARKSIADLAPVATSPDEPPVTSDVTGEPSTAGVNADQTETSVTTSDA
jgi:hypothetical protein